jgi:mitochondrial import inner membrane translocase subunit TIM44
LQPFSVWEANLKPSTEIGLVPDGQVLDIRGVDIARASIYSQLEIPVFVVGFKAQEIHVYRDSKTGEIKAGVQDRIQQVTYVMVLTRVAEEVFNPETGGWKVIDFARALTRDWI